MCTIESYICERFVNHDRSDEIVIIKRRRNCFVVQIWVDSFDFTQFFIIKLIIIRNFGQLFFKYFFVIFETGL